MIEITIKLAWDREFVPALRAGVKYRVVGRGWGWNYVGPILFQVQGRRR